MSFSKIHSDFAARGMTPVTNKIIVNRFIDAIKKFITHVITFGATSALHEAEAEHQRELFDVTFAIWRSLPANNSKIKATDYKEIYSATGNAWKIVQNGHQLSLIQWDAEKNAASGAPVELANFEKQGDFLSFKAKLSEIEQNDEYQKTINEKINAINNIDYKGEKLLHHLSDIAKKYVFENSENYLNQPNNVVMKRVRKDETEESINLEKKERSDLNSDNKKEIDDLNNDNKKEIDDLDNDKDISAKERKERLAIIEDEYDKKLSIIEEKYGEKQAIIEERYYKKQQIPLKDIAIKKSGSFEKYINDKIENNEFSEEDYIPILEFFLIHAGLQKTLIDMDIDKSYIVSIIDDRLNREIRKLHEMGDTQAANRMTTERMNFSKISDMLNHIQSTQGN